MKKVMEFILVAIAMVFLLVLGMLIGINSSEIDRIEKEMKQSNIDWKHRIQETKGSSEYLNKEEQSNIDVGNSDEKLLNEKTNNTSIVSENSFSFDDFSISPEEEQILLERRGKWWEVYENTKFGFLMKVPKEKELGTSTVSIVERANGVSFIRKDANGKIEGSWDIIVGNAKNDAELKEFIKKTFSPYCTLGEKRESAQPGVFNVGIYDLSDGTDPSNTKCLHNTGGEINENNYGFIFKYAPESGRVYTWSTGQWGIFDIFDKEMVKSFIVFNY